jgi:hypothetical protein
LAVSALPTRKTVSRRRSLAPPHKLCLSCQHGEVHTSQNRLRIYCAQEYRQATTNCPSYQNRGTQTLLAAIANYLQQLQRDYRQRFERLQPDCWHCVQNCCTTPFLTKTPFYPEDAIYYLLRDQPLPQVPMKLKHCMFFQRGCTLPLDLRPHVCIEYQCIYQNDITIKSLGGNSFQATIDLLAITTGDYQGWRGVYNTETWAELRERGYLAGRTYDRFYREWNPENPTQDLQLIYQPWIATN